MPPEHWAYDAAVKVHDHDPNARKQLLDEADLPDPDGDGAADPSHAHDADDDDAAFQKHRVYNAGSAKTRRHTTRTPVARTCNVV